MHRLVRPLIGLTVLALLAAVVAGSALAGPTPAGPARDASLASSHEPQPGTEQLEGETLDAASADRIVGKLDRAGIATDAGTLTALAEVHGVGGAVRLLAWSQASTQDVAALAEMRTQGLGWGEIRLQLDPDGELGLHPGIGWIMRGGNGAGAGEGQGRDTAPGQANRP